MDTLTKKFPYSKSFMLNVLYDTLEKIEFNLVSANSERGTLIALPSGFPNHKMRIACETFGSENQTTIQIFPDRMDNTGRQQAEMLMEELVLMVMRSTNNNSDKPCDFMN